jgi:hypothetical protein
MIYICMAIHNFVLLFRCNVRYNAMFYVVQLRKTTTQSVIVTVLVLRI